MRARAAATLGELVSDAARAVGLKPFHRPEELPVPERAKAYEVIGIVATTLATGMSEASTVARLRELEAQVSEAAWRSR